MGKDVAKALNDIFAKLNNVTNDIVQNKTEVGQDVQTTTGGVLELAEVVSDIADAVQELAEVVSTIAEG